MRKYNTIVSFNKVAWVLKMCLIANSMFRNLLLTQQLKMKYLYESALTPECICVGNLKNICGMKVLKTEVIPI